MPGRGIRLSPVLRYGIVALEVLESLAQLYAQPVIVASSPALGQFNAGDILGNNSTRSFHQLIIVAARPP